MTTEDRFIGAWRVREYVYEPDGRLAGVVDQRRTLERVGDGRTRVVQTCEPNAELQHHAMGRFRGRWIFELEREGRVRRYLGPDVVGSGFGFGPSAMFGRGLWPRFGHGFTSFSLLTGERQITGGCFFDASALVARIVGVATPDHPEATWPALSSVTWPGEHAADWTGTVETYGSDGALAKSVRIRRRYSSGERERKLQEVELEGGAGGELRLTLRDLRLASVNGMLGGLAVDGLARTSGPLLELELQAGPRTRFEGLEILDCIDNRVVGLRKRFDDETLVTLEVLRLEPER